MSDSENSTTGDPEDCLRAREGAAGGATAVEGGLTKACLKIRHAVADPISGGIVTAEIICLLAPPALNRALNCTGIV